MSLLLLFKSSGLSQNCSGSVTPSGSLVKQTSRALAGSTTAVGALAKRTSRALAGSVTATGSLVTSFIYGGVNILLNGIAALVRISGLTIFDALNDAPNTCSLRVDSPIPQTNQSLSVSVGSTSLFTGTLQTVDMDYDLKGTNLVYPCKAIDDTNKVNMKRPFGSWTNTSATTVAQALVSSFASSFSSSGVAAALPNISITFDGSETFIACLARMAKLIGGYCKVDGSVVYLFLTDSTDLPDDITDTNLPLNDPPITRSVDVSQLRTRVYGKGYGENVTTDVLAGETILPVENGVNFTATGGKAITALTADAAQSQIIAYGGVTLAAGGTLVGIGAAPTTKPTLVLSNPSQTHVKAGASWVGIMATFAPATTIAFDASTVTTRSDGVTSKTGSHTCTGANRLLFVHVLGDGSLDGITGVTYNGVAMTLIVKKQMPAGSFRWSYLYYLIAPATGANNIVVSASAPQSIAFASASYTGALQSGVPDAYTTNTSSLAASLQTYLVRAAAGSWAIYGTLNDQGAATMGTGTTQRQSSIYGQALSDTNGIQTLVENGAHDWAYLFKTAAGRTLPSPLTSLTIGSVSAPSTTATAGTPTAGAGLDGGDHRYYPVFRTALGSTTAGPVTNAVTAVTGVAIPTIPAVTPSFLQDYYGYPSPLDTSATYDYRITLRNNSDGTETTGSATSSTTAAASTRTGFRIEQLSVPAGYTAIFYRRKNATGNWKECVSMTAFTTYISGSSGPTETQWWDTTAEASLGQVIPSVNSTVQGVCAITGIPVSSNPLVLYVDLYRTFNYADASTAKLAVTVANGVTSASDSTPNASLGATVPSSNTAVGTTASVTVPAGPTGTTDIEVYRTTTGVTGLANLKLAFAVGSNTAGTYTDSVPDASLGAAAPSSDTSGLSLQAGQVNAGSTTLLVASSGPFTSTGGWVLLSGQQVVRYTGISGNSLTGIPPTGPGSIGVSILYGSQALPSPVLTGVTGMTSGMAKGSAVAIWVQRDDTAAQTAQIARAGGGDGIVEYMVSDERRAEPSLTALCDANLALFSYPIITVRYACRDIKTKSGKQITFNLTAPFITDTLTIQSVTIDQIGTAQSTRPRFTAVASNVRFSLEDTLRRLVAGATAR